MAAARAESIGDRGPREAEEVGEQAIAACSASRGMPGSICG